MKWTATALHDAGFTNRRIRWNMSNTLPALPPRPVDGHKGTFGTVCVIGGQSAPPRVMLGGPAFAALAALRSGCGLAVLAVPEPLMNHELAIAPSATGLALPIDANGAIQPSEAARVLDEHITQFSCIAVGPGLGAGVPQQQLMIRLVSDDETPLVIDADGLIALSQMRDFKGDFRAQAVLTPHVGEFKRLAHALGMANDGSVDATREEAATELAQRLGCVVVLKAHHTVVSDGMQAWTNTRGSVALATAGSGDVLTGLIAGFIAQFFKQHLGVGAKQVTPQQQGGLSLYDCARLAVHVHALAGEAWAKDNGNAGLLAAELLEMLPRSMRKLRAS